MSARLREAEMSHGREYQMPVTEEAIAELAKQYADGLIGYAKWYSMTRRRCELLGLSMPVRKTRPKSYDKDEQLRRSREIKKAWKARNPDKVKADNARQVANGNMAKWGAAYQERNPGKLAERAARAIATPEGREHRRQIQTRSRKKRSAEIRSDPVLHEEQLQKQRAILDKKRGGRPLMKGGRKRVFDDDERRIARRLRVRLQNALRRKSIKKLAATFDLLGVSIREFKLHIQSQFRDGMSWSNHGEWELDHIRPIASFDLRDEAQQRLCFHFTNFQPLWASENRKKADKYAEAA